ncbi:Putative Zinc finger HIT domain-containing protein [Septoria linicola]|uniref:Zinc finger HIT domain-containing protein n=1 Tax=Septoria linicola TaxID=215465 RepID=A0A9Q9AK75_9PEZI|nr:putative Zinc finger HIT domain-containing protein [Septoria linicola]USW47451.1 Putative Zinc finger HIT domain-containing protein [Septoria linicola]
MAIECGVCHENESKYRCPKCDIRFCSVPCSKIHKTTHENAQVEITAPAPQSEHPEQVRHEDRLQAQQDARLETTEQSRFHGFEHDPELKRLIARYPDLKHEIQLVYGLTMEPGPEEAYTWGNQKWFDDNHASQRARASQNRGNRGRGRASGGGRGGRGRLPDELPFDERQRGPWTQSKGDKQGLEIMGKLRATHHLELSEGMREFIKLCSMKFGQ